MRFFMRTRQHGPNPISVRKASKKGGDGKVNQYFKPVWPSLT